VLSAGNDPQAYAGGIVAVCKFYLESPLVCAAGITGSNLKKRIETIRPRSEAVGKLALVTSESGLFRPFTALRPNPPRRAKTFVEPGRSPSSLVHGS
jgi:hypothetical protein